MAAGCLQVTVAGCLQVTVAGCLQVTVAGCLQVTVAGCLQVTVAGCPPVCLLIRASQHRSARFGRPSAGAAVAGLADVTKQHSVALHCSEQLRLHRAHANLGRRIPLA
eukprot:scaffold5227_cov105-Isochrysis_galbana.AAC.3